MLKKFITPLIVICLLLSACAPSSIKSTTEAEGDELPASRDGMTYPLSKTEDLGMEYIDSFIFLGESTTYHLKNRGVLSGGTDTLQVWGPKSGTLMLDPTIASCRIVYPETNEEIDIGEAAKRKKPSFVLLTFGLNGATVNISKGREYFLSCYKKLIDTILAASPQTKIILQSCFPVAKNMNMSSYSIDLPTLNRYIDTINERSCQLAKERSLGYLNTSEILKNSDGYLIDSYQAGDGYHLTREAYIKILEYIRTHGYPTEEIQ